MMMNGIVIVDKICDCLSNRNIFELLVFLQNTNKSDDNNI